MSTDFPTAPLASCRIGAAGGGTVEKSLSASHTKILTLPPSLVQLLGFVKVRFGPGPVQPQFPRLAQTNWP